MVQTILSHCIITYRYYISTSTIISAYIHNVCSNGKYAFHFQQPNQTTGTFPAPSPTLAINRILTTLFSVLTLSPRKAKKPSSPTVTNSRKPEIPTCRSLIYSRKAKISAWKFSKKTVSNTVVSGSLGTRCCGSSWVRRLKWKTSIKNQFPETTRHGNNTYTGLLGWRARRSSGMVQQAGLQTCLLSAARNTDICTA